MSIENAEFLGWWISRDGNIVLLDRKKGQIYQGIIFSVETETEIRSTWNSAGINCDLNEGWDIIERIPNDDNDGGRNQKITKLKQKIKYIKKIRENSSMYYVPSIREMKEGKKEAIRNPVDCRYDILDVDFLHLMAQIGNYGAIKYGNLNWQLSKLTEGKSPINHIYKHLRSYRKGEKYDHKEVGENKSIHLAAIAFNAMMEFYWAVREERDEEILKGKAEIEEIIELRKKQGELENGGIVRDTNTENIQKT